MKQLISENKTLKKELEIFKNRNDPEHAISTRVQLDQKKEMLEEKELNFKKQVENSIKRWDNSK